MTLTSPANNAVFTAPATITLTAAASDTDGTIASVEFLSGANVVATITSAPYTFTVNNLGVGSFSFSARATDNLGAATTSSAVAVTVVANTPPTVSITAPANNATFVAPASIPLTAQAADTDGTVAKVEFFQGVTLIATVTAAPYSVTLANAQAGSYTLTAKATDNQGAATASSPVGITVNAPPTVSLTAPANNAIFTAPATIMLTATAADPDGSIAKVDFFQGAALLGTVTAAPYTLSVANVAAGSYALTAVATDNLGATTASSAVNVTVNPNQPPSVSLTSPANNAIFTAPATITLTATASDADGTVTQGEFLSGANVIATLTNPPYTFTLNNVAAGSYTFTARVTDDKGAQTTSASVTVTVTAASATIFYIYTDQLNTPRAITNEAATTIWKWDNNDPFGANAPDEDPDGDGNKFTCNLRFPGQYFDKETGTHYNYFRDYDPAIGRYVEFDPIGLKGGINGYPYVSSNPLGQSDPTGLAVWLCLRSTSFGIGNHAYFYDDKTKQCCGDPGPGGKNPLQSCRERGTSGDSCVLISSSNDDAQKLLKCCNDRTNKSFYFPGVNDCQNLADDCIRQLGMAPSATPGFNRWRPCPTCFRQ